METPSPPLLFPPNPQPDQSPQPPPQNPNPNQHIAKAIHLRSGTQYEGPLVMVEDSERVIRDEREQEEELRDEDIREEFEERNVEKEKDKSERSRELGEERKSKIEERKRLERLYPPAIPFPYRRVEKQLDEKWKIS